MKPSLHLTFAGQCEAAFTFYVRSLGATIGPMLRYGDSPAAADVPPDWRDKIVHGSVTVGGRMVAGADVLPADYEKPQGFYILLDVEGEAEARRVFDALSAGGMVRMPLQKTFWSPAFGALVDQFGIPWEISCA